MVELKPTGYYVLVKMEAVEKTINEGSLKGFVIQSSDEHEREQAGHDVGIVVSFGPTSFAGYQGIEGECAISRAAEWGVQIHDKIEFNRYDGKVPSHPDFQEHRIIQDAHIIGVIEEMKDD